MTQSTHVKRKAEVVDQDSKRPRFVWTKDLHENFIASIFDIGVAHITAEKLLESSSQEKKNLSHTLAARFISTIQEFRFVEKDYSLKQVQELTKIPTAKLHLLEQAPGQMPKKSAPKPVALESSESNSQPVTKPKRVRKQTVSPKPGPRPAPVLSKEALMPYSSGTFLHKEFPNLKDVHVSSRDFLLSLQRTYGILPSSESVGSDASRPFSPLSSDIDSYEFDWERETFDSSVIKMYLEA